jgi:hypothetical protein
MEDSGPLSPTHLSIYSAPPTYYSPTPQVERAQNPIGLYGWRKRCLYFVIVLVVVLMLVNLGLTIWILVVLDFNVVSESHLHNYSVTKNFFYCPRMEWEIWKYLNLE